MSTKLVNLKDGSDYLVPKVFGGMDTNNVIAQSVGIPYTATTDSWAITKANSSSSYSMTINGKYLGHIQDGMANPVPLKNGDVLNGTTGKFTISFVFGIKY